MRHPWVTTPVALGSYRCIEHAFEALCKRDTVPRPANRPDRGPPRSAPKTAPTADAGRTPTVWGQAPPRSTRAGRRSFPSPGIPQGHQVPQGRLRDTRIERLGRREKDREIQRQQIRRPVASNHRGRPSWCRCTPSTRSRSTLRRRSCSGWWTRAGSAGSPAPGSTRTEPDRA